MIHERHDRGQMIDRHCEERVHLQNVQRHRNDALYTGRHHMSATNLLLITMPDESLTLSEQT